MPPHCDSLDGPVVMAARRALDESDVALVLPYVSVEGEEEVRRAFDDVSGVRRGGGEAAGVAERYFFETVVRVHRAGEGEPYTGLKPAGLDVGPAIPLAEHAIATGDTAGLVRLLTGYLEDHVRQRFATVQAMASGRDGTVESERAYVAASLGFQVYCGHLYKAIASGDFGHAPERSPS